MADMASSTKGFGSENMPLSGRAVAYLRTSSATNVGGDSSQRQREAIHAYAARSGLEVAQEFYDAAVSGADPLDQREGFTALLAWCAETGVRIILVENASRFARDLIVQETGHALLKGQGFSLIAADDPDAFTADTPTARMVRQILGAVSEFEKANLVAKLKGARDRASAANGGKRIEGRKGYADKPKGQEIIKEAKRLHRKNPKTGKVRTLRDIAAELAKLGHVNGAGKEFSAMQVRRLLGKPDARPLRDDGPPCAASGWP
ncbi:recombinase family protein [Teichococcus vastitatis]|uniref:Recombinase family protein n=1 Tax=Teichococcus vastitatis TaxID=2307076 RepID=A0ABS9W0C5_9PROT|nr:recombinase family protein [Pseudoroseomonas vastitatis]MCI0752752.1 recombinase family protein [Pseudoroseomonas vastitatis]